MRDLLPPLFQLFTGLAFLGFLVVGIFARKAFIPLLGKLIGFGALGIILGLFLLSQATGSTSIGAGAELFIAAGIASLTGVLLVFAGLFVLAQSQNRA